MACLGASRGGSAHLGRGARQASAATTRTDRVVPPDHPFHEGPGWASPVFSSFVAFERLDAADAEALIPIAGTSGLFYEFAAASADELMLDEPRFSALHASLMAGQWASSTSVEAFDPATEKDGGGKRSRSLPNSSSPRTTSRRRSAPRLSGQARPPRAEESACEHRRRVRWPHLDLVDERFDPSWTVKFFWGAVHSSWPALHFNQQGCFLRTRYPGPPLSSLRISSRRRQR